MYRTEEFVGRLTREQAEYVRYLRVDLGYSWRAVARECWWEWRQPEWISVTLLDEEPTREDSWSVSGNQLDGMDLCSAACELLGVSDKEAADKW